jgi:Doubled CXXCH motif (Paired_CXXCH_1)
MCDRLRALRIGPLLPVVLGLSLLLPVVLGPNSVSGPQTTMPGQTRSPIFSGQVLSAGALPVAGATVHLVPTTAIDMTPITASAVYFPPYPAEAYDEPLEDTIRAKGTGFPQATTDEGGTFSISDIPDGKFFVHVTPNPTDEHHLQGGDKSREAYAAEKLRGASMTINVSSRPSQSATFVGTTACLECHKDYATVKQTGHKVAWAVPGRPGPLQDFSRFPEYFKSLASFKDAEDYTQGTRLELGDYEPQGGDYRFKLRQFSDARLPITKIYADVYLWKRQGHSTYYITLANRLNPQDPNSPAHLEVQLTYGGAVHRQRFIVAVPPSLGVRKAKYAVLQYLPDGRDNRLHSGRRLWRDYKLHDWWDPGADRHYGTRDDVIKAPPLNQNTIEAMCAGCHVTGVERYTDPATGEVLVRGVNDGNGEFNIDDDPELDEINLGCETCHGPGSEHGANAGMSDDFEMAIVNPQYLSAERSNVVCGRCHDRRQGVGGKYLAYTQAINQHGRFMLPGESRHTMLTEYSDPKKKGPIPGRDIWSDDIHSRSPHQQYADFLKSTKYKNDRQLVVCSDCHNMHGGTAHRRWLTASPDNPASPLCQRCHEVNILEHMEKKLNSKMKGLAGTTCIDCHMPGTVFTGGGAGAYGRMIKTPLYQDAAEEQKSTYWESGINSHVFDVPRKTNVAVRGVNPGEAMPMPYTNSCGTCHVVNELPHK